MRPGAKAQSVRWLRKALQIPQFSFDYGGTPSKLLLPRWQAQRTTIPQPDHAVLHRNAYRDHVSGLECRLELTEYPKSSALEWVVWFRNTGAVNTPIISAIRALDMRWDCSGRTPAFLHYSVGARGRIDDFTLRRQKLAAHAEFELAAAGDGSSRTYLPFFNLETGKRGLMIGIGWTGLWAIAFKRSANGAIAVRAGLPNANLVLHPGEEIRTPRILLLFWRGEGSTSHNLLRRHLVAWHLPKFRARPVKAPICCLTWGGMKTANHLKLIRFIRERGLRYDYYWIDAGWYGPDHATEEFQKFYTEDWAYHVGHWRVNRAVHPRGLRPIVKAARAAGMKVLLWFGPYIAVENSPLIKKHPDWILRLNQWGAKGIGLNPKPVKRYELDLGIPGARRGLARLFSGLIREHGVACFRDDCNIPVADVEEPDRRGMSEIQNVTAFYAFWDELLKRHPGLLIDNCGGGGSRIDLETIGRSLVLWRSDFNCDPAASPIGFQAGTCGISHWVPLVGGTVPASPGNTYNFRSSWSGGLPFGLFHPGGYGKAATAPASDYPVAWHRKMIEQYRRARIYYTGDFYPLTNCSLSTLDWFAYQMDRPDLGEGLVLAFRRQDSPRVTAVFQLRGLVGRAKYRLENPDTGERSIMGGEALGNEGLTVTMPKAPESRLLFYKRL